MKFRINPLISILLIVAVSSLLLYLLQKRQADEATAAPVQQIFVGAGIKGRLTFKSLRYGVQSIRVDNDTQIFRFKPDLTSNGLFFHVHTELGDSIIKEQDKMEVVVKNAFGTVRYKAAAID